MGKSKLFGSGSGKPVNAVKVTEFAGEDIPANCFVQKISGKSVVNSESLSNSITTAPLWGVWVNEDIYVCYLSSTATLYVYYKGQHSSSTTLSSNMYCAVVLRETRQLILTPSAFGGAGSYSSMSITAFQISETGILSKIFENKYYVPTQNIGNILQGFYPNDFFYTWDVASSDVNTMYFYKNTISSTGLNSTLVSAVALPRAYYYATPLIYLEECDAAFVSGDDTGTNYGWVSLLNMSTWKFEIDVLTDNSIYGRFYAVEYMGTGISAFLPYSKKICISKTYSGSQIFVIDLVNGTAEYKSLTIPSGLSEVYMGGLFEYLSNEGTPKILCLYSKTTNTSAGVFLGNIDLTTLTLTNIATLHATSTYYKFTPGYSIAAWTKYKSRNRVQIWEWFYTSSSNDYYVRFMYDYSEPHIEIPDTEAIYGIASSPIKANEQGTVYCVDTSYPSAAYTTYGLPETLVAQIVDDSVDEIKQEVQNG